jgi:hypothetical protein
VKGKTNQPLIDYFGELYEWREQNLREKEASSEDRLAIIVLKITTWLLSDLGLGKIIAKELSLIVDLPERPDASEELMQAMDDMEDNDLESHLKGISSFMTWILEDTKIRCDGLIALKTIPNLSPELSFRFERLIMALDAYLELEEAFEISTPKAAAVMFLVGFLDIFAYLLDLEQEDAHLGIKDWIKARIKKDAISNLYTQAMVQIDQPWPNKDGGILAKDLVVVLLCFRTTDWRAVKLEELTLIDNALLSIGTFGIKPLLEAGFLSLDESARSHELIKKSPKILRAP